jgi:small GTP-binding protein
VGKTALITNFAKNKFSKDYLPTIGANLIVKEIDFDWKNEHYNIIVNTWDIAGQQAWSSIRHSYLKGSQGVFIVGDVTRKETFSKIEEYWLNDARKYTDQSIPIILLANKIDLNHDIDEKEIKSIIIKNKIKSYYFTSAKTSKNVYEAFMEMVKICLSTL